MVFKICIYVFFNVNWWYIINIFEKMKMKNKIKYIFIKLINKVNNKLIKWWIFVVLIVFFDFGLRDWINCCWLWSFEVGIGGICIVVVFWFCFLMVFCLNWNYIESLGY